MASRECVEATSDCGLVPDILTAEQRQSFENAVLLIDGFDRLTNSWWQDKLRLPPERLEEITRLRKKIKREVVGPFNSSLFSGGDPQKMTRLLTEVTLKVNIQFGIQLTRLLTQEERRRLLQQIRQIGLENQIFRDAAELSASIQILRE